jgi:CRP/FNR family cyclic AMP-dependent transcriptional regulator
LIPTILERRTGGPSALHLGQAELEDASTPDFFAGLSAEEKGRLQDASSVLHFRAGQHVFSQGQFHTGIFIILSGRVRSYCIGPTGREISLAYWSHGDLVGGPEVFGGGRHMWSGLAVTPTRVMHVRGPELRRLMTEIPKLAISVVEALVHKGKCYSAMIEMLGTRSAAARLAQLLLVMADNDGRIAPEGLLVERSLTHDDIGKMIGATRQWVRKTLDRLVARRLIKMRATCIVIVDRKELCRFAGSSDELPPAGGPIGKRPRAHRDSSAGEIAPVTLDTMQRRHQSFDVFKCIIERE